MSVMSSSAVATRARRGPSGSALARLVATELTLYTRERLRLWFGLAMPVILLIILGSFHSLTKPDATLGGYSFLDIYLPTLITFVLAILSIVNMPMVLSGYREIGVLRRMETTPAGPLRVLAAQMLANLGVAIVAMLLLLVVGRTAYHLALPHQLGGFVIAWLLAAAALLSIGLFIAALTPTARTAQISGVLVFYPCMFFAGLWVPISKLSPFWQHFSHATPSGAAAEALTSASHGQWPSWLQLVTLAGYAVVAIVAAARLFRWE
jgi:ABC-2 type transport system permease protein